MTINTNTDSLATGTCGFCARGGFKLTNNRLSRHGFRKPGSHHSFFSSYRGCPGSGSVALEISDETLVQLRAALQQALVHSTARITELGIDSSESISRVLNYSSPANGWASVDISETKYRAQGQWRRMAAGHLATVQRAPADIAQLDADIAAHHCNN